MNGQVHPRTHCRGQSVGRTERAPRPRPRQAEAAMMSLQTGRPCAADEKSRRTQLVLCTRREFAFCPFNCPAGLLRRSRTCARYLNAHPTWAIRVPVFPSLSVCGAQRKDHRAVYAWCQRSESSGRSAVWPWLCGLTRTFTRAVRRKASFGLDRQPQAEAEALDTHPRSPLWSLQSQLAPPRVDEFLWSRG